MSEHSREVTARVMEPGDGGRLIVRSGDEWTVIWRDDAEAARWEAAEGDRWFGDENDDPMALHEHLKYAEMVYEVGPVVAHFEDV